MHHITINKSVNVLFFLFLFFASLYFARPFLEPFALAAVIAMLLLPLSKNMEKRGVNRAFAALLSLFVLLLAISGIIALLIWQISDIASDFNEMKRKVLEIIHNVQGYLNIKFGITEAEQKKFLDSTQSSGSGGVTRMLSNTMTVLIDLILVLVYIFIFIYFRHHLKRFVLKLVAPAQIPKTEKIIHDSTQVSYKYLSGLTMMIVILWILYGIGFSLVGINNALFFAILCGVLEIIPFVGNLTGTSITLLMAITQGGGGGMIVGVLLTYFFVQFVQTYIIEPLVVGAEVNINPLFTIIALVVGELLWGIVGLILAIPLLGMFKIVCDNIEILKPYGFLIGEEKRKRTEIAQKIKTVFKKSGT